MLEARPRLRLETLLRGLQRYNIRFVVTGGVAARIHGLETQPQDLDIAPDLEPDNLRNIAKLLTEWHARPADPNEASEWSPEPPDQKNLDHRFWTAHGELDIVPVGSGRFDAISTRAIPVVAFDVPFLVAHVEDLQSSLRFWNREKDQNRLADLSTSSLPNVAGDAPTNVEGRLAQLA